MGEPVTKTCPACGRYQSMGPDVGNHGPGCRLVARAPSILEMLRELQWHGDQGPCRSCIECDGTKPNHAPDCRLAALLASVETPKEST